MLALSEKGDNSNVDMLVGDICQSNDYLYGSQTISKLI